MKRSGILFFAMALFLFSCEEEAKEALEEEQETTKSQSNTGPQKSGNVKVGGGTTIIFGTKCCPNKDATGCEGDKGMCLIIKSELAEASPELGEGEGIAEVSVTKEGKIFWGIKDDYDEENKGDRFQVLEDHELSREVSQALGYERITIQKGNYEVDYSQKENYPFGVVELEADLEE